MPESFDVTDDPTAAAASATRKWTTKVCRIKKLSLVEKGILKDFLRTREPGARLYGIEWPRAAWRAAIPRRRT